MKVLLLGATGLLGHNVLRRLLAEGHQVIALVRKGGRIQMEHEGCKVMECENINDRRVLFVPMSECDAVINCAGVTDMSLLSIDDYIGINCDLVRTIISMMELTQIKRLVHVSTVNTIGYGTIEHPTDESEQAVFPFSESLYAESKRMGEQAVMEGKDAHPDLEGIIVNPGFMIGSYDTKPSSGRLLLAGYRKPVMFAPRGGKAFVNVVDVAEVVVNALTMGTPGRKYIVTNSKASLTFKELYKLQAHVCGYRQRVIQIPNWVLLAVGHVGEWLRRMGLRTQVSLNNIQQMLVREYYDNSAARRDLGLKETSIEDAIRDFYEWRKNRH